MGRHPEGLEALDRASIQKRYRDARRAENERLVELACTANELALECRIAAGTTVTLGVPKQWSDATALLRDLADQLRVENKRRANVQRSLETPLAAPRSARPKRAKVKK